MVLEQCWLVPLTARGWIKNNYDNGYKNSSSKIMVAKLLYDLMFKKGGGA
jgi:hypothetical protein